MLRELLIGEAMHALGIPTTRGLAVVATGEDIARDSMLPGAVLSRVAASHLRVGTFQYAAATGDLVLLQRLTDHAIARHHPDAADADHPALALLERVLVAQATLVASWMLVGFIHGVMNTDNMTISGETIDYGPCAFMDSYDPATVFSSIDHGGRYAYGNQPRIANWNMARLAEALLPLIDDDTDTAVAAATAVLRSFTDRFQLAYDAGMRAKLGLADEREGDDQLVAELLRLMHAQKVDFTSCFRALSKAARGDVDGVRSRFAQRQEFDGWSSRWLHRLGSDREAIAAQMDRVNPVYIPRNHLVEEALAAATMGDMTPFERLREAFADPFQERDGLERYAEPAPPAFDGTYRTFCGT
jgi:uncharacterized protein YdiU (UPF0061 family)